MFIPNTEILKRQRKPLKEHGTGSSLSAVRLRENFVAQICLQHKTNMDHSRAAIALNNIGVSLLERSCYVQALEVLRDAVSTMQGSLNETESCAARWPDHQVYEKLRRGMHYLACPEQHQTCLYLEIVNSDALSTKACCTMSRDPSLQEAFAIRIEKCDHDSNGQYPAMETAIMLHNLGLSYLCLASASRSAHVGPLKGAMTLFAASYKILQNQKDQCAEENILTSPSLSLETIVLSKLIAVLVELNEAEQAKPFYTTFMQLADAMHFLEGFEECFHERKHAAGAA